MRVVIIGAGIAGLSAASYLAEAPGVRVTVFERSPVAGGRADVVAGGEHCPRFFTDDYVHLLPLLDSVPGPDGGSVRDSLRPIRRHYRTTDGEWTEISHLYRFRAREIPFVERLRIVWESRRSPLVADDGPAIDTNRYGSLLNVSPVSLALMVRNLMRSTGAYTSVATSTSGILVIQSTHG